MTERIVPKVIDHEQRKRELAHAVVAVASEHGLHAATLRAVAERSGHSMGSVQHSFPTRDDMLHFVLRYVQERRGERIRDAVSALRNPTPFRVIEEIVDAVMSDDATNLRFERVRGMFLAAALHDPATAELLRGGPGLVVSMLTGLLDGARAQGVVRPDVDPRIAAETLWTLLDAVPSTVFLGQRTHADARRLLAGALDALRVDGTTPA